MEIFWSLDVDLSNTIDLSVCAYLLPCPFSSFSFYCAHAELGNDWEFAEPLGGMLKIITIRNSMFLAIQAILMHSAYFVFKRSKNKF